MSNKTTKPAKGQNQSTDKNHLDLADLTEDIQESLLLKKTAADSHSRQSTEVQRHEQNQHTEQQLKQQQHEQNERDQFQKGNAQEHQQGNRQH